VRGEWFENYTEFITRYARMAESLNCEMFNVGTELNGTVNDDTDLTFWRNQVIPAVRRVYSGPITFAEMGMDGGVLPDLWHDLDFVGVDAYFELYPRDSYPSGDWRDTASGQKPKVADLLTGVDPYNPLAWQQKWLFRLDTLRQQTEKPIIFPEIGYVSCDSSAWRGAASDWYMWVKESTYTDLDLYAVSFPDTFTGFAVGESGVVKKTTNGGLTWYSKSSGTTLDLYALSFPTCDTGYAVGAYGEIVRTDSGWENSYERAVDGQHANLRGVSFPVSVDTGYVVGDGGLAIKTTDGGNTWTGMSVDTTADLRAVHFPCRDTGFIVGDAGLILRTTNRGDTWTLCNSPTTRTLHAVYFSTPDTGCAVGDRGSYLRTVDGGVTWTCWYRQWDTTVTHRGVTLPRKRQHGDTSAYVVGDDNLVLRIDSIGYHWAAIDGGRQYTRQQQNLNGICFPDSVVGFAVGDSGTILKTWNGGRMRIDFQEQRIGYEAAFQALWRDSVHLDPLPWFYGFHWYDWSIQPYPKEVDHEIWINLMTFQQKPAEDVVTNWFAARPEDPGPAGYHVRHYPTGSLDAVVPASGKVNEPLVVCKLESRDWEEGGTADSARLIQEYYGTGDTLIAVDSTGWFGFTTDTMLQLVFGEGKYRLPRPVSGSPGQAQPAIPRLRGHAHHLQRHRVDRLVLGQWRRALREDAGLHAAHKHGRLSVLGSRDEVWQPADEQPDPQRSVLGLGWPVVVLRRRRVRYRRPLAGGTCSPVGLPAGCISVYPRREPDAVPFPSVRAVGRRAGRPAR
jgi:photosystem II stability/assembly factor-like uncharacterized protein